MSSLSSGLRTGRVRRVNGPVVDVVGLEGVAMFDVVAIGASGLAGEIVGIDEDVATAQVYEYDGGVAPGDPVESRGEALSITLGPGLLGGVFDGILRPLEPDTVWLTPGRNGASAAGMTWRFSPAATIGAQLTSGALLGRVTEGEHFEHRILRRFPPGPARPRG